MNFPEYAKKALFMLNNAFLGAKAYFVGGCVRDFIMNKPFNDIDITTNLLPDQIVELFCMYKTLDIGKKHGTITVFIDENKLEITTYRLELEYEIHRRPKNVLFCSSLIEDLKRRDFTINSICIGINDEIIDEFSGQKDIDKKIIKAIGNPEKRFNEDALRILRAFRFMSKLSFKIEENTCAAIKKTSHLLSGISKQRIKNELYELLLGENPYEALSLMKELNVLDDMLLDMTKPLQNALLSSPKCFEIRACLVFKDEGYSRLSISKEVLKTISFLKLNKDLVISLDKISLKKLLFKFSPPNIRLLLSLKKCCGENINELSDMLDFILINKECYCFEQLKINGNDIKALGFEEKSIGKIKASLLNAVIEEKVINEKEKLISYLKM